MAKPFTNPAEIARSWAETLLEMERRTDMTPKKYDAIAAVSTGSLEFEASRLNLLEGHYFTKAGKLLLYNYDDASLEKIEDVEFTGIPCTYSVLEAIETEEGMKRRERLPSIFFEVIYPHTPKDIILPERHLAMAPVLDITDMLRVA